MVTFSYNLEITVSTMNVLSRRYYPGLCQGKGELIEQVSVAVKSIKSFTPVLFSASLPASSLTYLIPQIERVNAWYN